MSIPKRDHSHLNGTRVNHLIILNTECQNVAKFLVKCDCGFVLEMEKFYLLNGKTKSCGQGDCKADRVNQDGVRFGKLTVSKWYHEGRYAKLVCDCGAEVIALRHKVSSGKKTTCGKGKCHGLVADLTNQEFGYWQVVKYDVDNEYEHTHWICECVCGTTRSVPAHTLMSGTSKSCGCMGNLSRSIKDTKADHEPLKLQVWYGYIKGAKERGLEFALPQDEFYQLLTQNCFYCGAPPSNCKKGNNKTSVQALVYNGIDRLHNEIGYLPGNCVSCCYICNFAKSDMALDHFIKWIDGLVKYRQGLRQGHNPAYQHRDLVDPLEGLPSQTNEVYDGEAPFRSSDWEVLPYPSGSY